MPTITRDQVRVPLDVAPDMRETYIDNFMKATRGTGRLMLFACDQKFEHLNGDFYGEGIDLADNDPEPPPISYVKGLKKGPRAGRKAGIEAPETPPKVFTNFIR